jgi:hypothetical protein
MELAPTNTLGTVLWEEHELIREVLAFQHLLLECIMPGTPWIDSGDRPNVTLQIGTITYPAQAGCMSISHDAITIVVGVPIESPAPPYPTAFLGFTKENSSDWKLLEQYVMLVEGDTRDVQEQANCALAMLMLASDT